MMFFWLILIVCVIWAIWFFGKEGKIFPSENQKDEAIDILKRRFAKGEIEEEEYEERKAVLEEDEYLNYNP